jgi:hypothetical protein
MWLISVFEGRTGKRFDIEDDAATSRFTLTTKWFGIKQRTGDFFVRLLDP